MNSLDYYSQRIMKELVLENVKNIQKESIIYTDSLSAQKIIELNPDFRPVKYLNHFNVTKLNFKFLNKNTRDQQLVKHVILMN